MSQFQGSSNKVRCVDCVKLSGKNCTAKKTKVAPKKRRLCSSYVFKGEFENREPLPAVYMPPIDKKTLKMIKKLMAMGITPVADGGDLQVTPEGKVLQQQSFEMPKSTATASVVGMKSNEDAALTSPNELADPGAEPVIWTPEGQEDEEGQQDNDRG